MSDAKSHWDDREPKMFEWDVLVEDIRLMNVEGLPRLSRGRMRYVITLVGILFTWSAINQYRESGPSVFVLCFGLLGIYYAIPGFRDRLFIWFLHQWLSICRIPPMHNRLLFEAERLTHELTEKPGKKPRIRHCSWSELQDRGQCQETPSSFLIMYPFTPKRLPYFNVWIPKRIFASDQERDEFRSLITSQMTLISVPYFADSAELQGANANSSCPVGAS